MNYCAFLRGVNVNGTNMKMADVSAVFTDCGMNNVTFVLASGNILFSSEKPAEQLKTILETALSEKFNYEAYLFIKTEEEIVEIIKNNPFDDSSELHLYIFIAQPKVEELLMEEFNLTQALDLEKATNVQHTFYWQVPKEMTLKSTFGKILGRKSLKNQFTSRNNNTILKVAKKFGAFPK